MTPNVILLAHTPNPTRIMALSARLCYTQGISISQLNDKLTDEQCEKLVKKILSNRHNGVLEHAVFTFGVEGVSRNFSHQMVRHRNTSFDQQSLHYTMTQEGFEMATPPGMAWSQQMEWKELKDRAFRLYRHLIASGIPKEEARHILPSGQETKLVMTANLRQWLWFVRLRACQVNCAEIIVVAHKVKNELQVLMPYLKEYLGPPCLTEGLCPEGKKFCNSPWKTPCRIIGDGLDIMIKTKEEALAFKP